MFNYNEECDMLSMLISSSVQPICAKSHSAGLASRKMRVCVDEGELWLWGLHWNNLIT